MGRGEKENGLKVLQQVDMDDDKFGGRDPDPGKVLKELQRLRVDLEAERGARKEAEQRILERLIKLEGAEKMRKREGDQQGTKDKEIDSPSIMVTPKAMRRSGRRRQPNSEKPETVVLCSYLNDVEDGDNANELTMAGTWTEKIEEMVKNLIEARLQDLRRSLEESLSEKLKELEMDVTSLRHVILPPVEVLVDDDWGPPCPSFDLGQIYLRGEGEAVGYEGGSEEDIAHQYEGSGWTGWSETDCETSSQMEPVFKNSVRKRGLAPKKKSKATPSKKKTDTTRKAQPKRSIRSSSMEKHGVDPTTTPKLISCLCGKSFRHKVDLTRHIGYFKDSKGIEQRAPCNLCRKVFRSTYQLRRHLRNTHKRRTIGTSLTKISTKKPVNVEGGKGSMTGHENDRKSKANPSKKTSSSSTLSLPSRASCGTSVQHSRDPSTPLTVWRCLCSRKFVRKTQLTRHLTYYGVGTHKYTCHLCGRVLGFPSDLKRHLGWHERKNANVSLKASPVKTEDPQGEEPTSPTKLVTSANSRLSNESESQSQLEQKPTHCLDKKTKVKGTTVYICKCGKRYFTHSGFKRHVKSFPWN